MASLSTTCPDCGADAEVAVGQSVVRGQIEWHRSLSCPHCGAVIEEDGAGETPEEIRQAILLDEGTWALRLAAAGRGRVVALGVLREALRLSLADVAAIQAAIPGMVVTGTRAEMLRLSELVSRRGIAAPVVGLPGNETAALGDPT